MSEYSGDIVMLSPEDINGAYSVQMQRAGDGIRFIIWYKAPQEGQPDRYASVHFGLHEDSAERICKTVLQLLERKPE